MCDREGRSKAGLQPPPLITGPSCQAISIWTGNGRPLSAGMATESASLSLDNFEFALDLHTAGVLAWFGLSQCGQDLRVALDRGFDAGDALVHFFQPLHDNALIAGHEIKDVKLVQQLALHGDADELVDEQVSIPASVHQLDGPHAGATQ